MRKLKRRVLWARETAVATNTVLGGDGDSDWDLDKRDLLIEELPIEADELFPDLGVDEVLRQNRGSAASGSFLGRALARCKAPVDANVDEVQTIGPSSIPETQQHPAETAATTYDPRAHLRVFSPGAAKLKLLETGIEPGEPYIPGSGSDRQSSAAMQERWWRRMAEDKTQGWRRRMIATREHISALDDLRPILPNFFSLLDIVGDALAASVQTGGPVRLPPTLLLGPPGVGKSYAADRIASTLGERCVSISMTTATGINPLGGADAVWRHPRIGLVAEALITHESASPILFLDEIDKPFTAGSHDQPLDPLHALLEPQTARAFKDELVEIVFDASQVTWIATANALNSIPAAIVDRFLVIEVAAPEAAQMGTMIRLMIAQAYSIHHDWFDAAIEDAVIAQLSQLHPRRLKRVVELACTAAAAAGERRLSTTHIQRAGRLVEAGVTRPKMGFRC
jgi:ATP-dependent Lon protease